MMLYLFLHLHLLIPQQHPLSSVSAKSLKRSSYQYHNLDELDPCPLCKVAIGYHTSTPSTTSTTGTGGKDGSKSTLPTWKKDYHQVKPLLDRVEQILTADAVDKKYWPRCLVGGDSCI